MSTLTGHCLCGGVAFEVAEPLRQAAYCHCTRCQRRTGNASSAGVRVAPGAVTITHGADLVKAWDPPDGNPQGVLRHLRRRAVEPRPRHA
jgi:hypothetical protein